MRSLLPRRALLDALLLPLLLAAGYAAAHAVDLFEWFWTWSRRHESWQADELLMSTAGVSLVLMGMAASRYVALRRATAALRRTTGALETAQRQLEHVLDASPVLIFLLRPSHQGGMGAVWISDNLHRLFGYASGAAVSREWWRARLHPEDRAGALAYGDQAAAGAACRHEFRFLTAGGEYRRILEELRPVAREDGTLEVVGSWTDITERAAADQALRESEERFRRLYDDTPAMFFTVAADATVLSVNRFAAESLGYAAGELVGRPVAEIFLPEDRERAVTLLAGALACPGQVREWQLRKVRRDGSVLWVQENGRAVRLPDGSEAVLIVCEDITHTKTAEASLRQAEQDAQRMAARMRAVAAGAAGVVGAHSLEELLGVLRDACRPVLAFDAFLFAVHEEAEGVMTYLGHYDRGTYGAPRAVSVAGTPAERMIRERRSLVTLRASDPGAAGGVLTGTGQRSESIIRTPILQDDRVIGMLSVQSYDPDRYDAADVEVLEAIAAVAAPVLVNLNLRTRVRASEEALLESELRFRSVVDSLSEALLITDLRNTVQYANPRVEELYGYRPEELVGRVAHEVLAEPAQWDEAAERLRSCTAGVAERYQVSHRRKDGGPLWLEVSGAPLRNGDGGIVGTIGAITDITERKQAEEAVRESEAKFRAIFSSAGVGVVLTDLRGVVVEANPAFERMLGYGREELTRMHLAQLTHPDDVEKNLRLFREMVAGERDGYDLEKRYLHAQGATVWARLTVSLLRSPAGEPLHVLGVIEDIMERRRNEETVRAQRAYLRAVIDADPTLIFAKDKAGRFTLANRSIAALYGVEPAELVGRTEADFIADAAQVEHFRAQDLAVLETGRSLLVPEERVSNPVTGEVRWYQTRKVCFVPPGGGPRQVLGIATDITERRRTEDAVHFQVGLLDVVAQAVVATDVEMRVLFWNRFAEELYGWTAAEALGRPLAELTPSIAGEEERSTRWAQVASGQRWTGELELCRRDGASFPAMVVLSPIRDAAGAVCGMIGVSSDLSDRKQLEQQFRQAQKMEAVGRLAGGVAHDFNNMLTAIRGNAQLILLDLPPDSELRHDVEEIDRAAERAAQLTRQLLAFSRSQVLQPRMLDLNTSVTAMETMLRRLIGEHIVLSTTLQPGLGTVRADPAQVEQVILNLAVNARDAMPDGGRLRIETRDVQVGGDDLPSPSEGMQPGAYVSLVVSDTGHGMTRETAERVFEPFFTTKAAGSGTGLGLSTVYGIVRQSGGYIWVDSAPGQGTQFRIYLPRVEAAPEALFHGAAPGRGPGGSETILLVEDEEAVATLAAKILSRSGYRVLRAGTGVEAIRLFEAHLDEVALVLTDVVMPEMGGRDLAEHLHARRATLPVLFTSGYMDAAAMRPDVFREGTEFLAKPFSPEALVRRVRQALDAAVQQPAA